MKLSKFVFIAMIFVIAGCSKESEKISVSLSPTSAEIYQDESITFSLSVSPSDAEYGAVSWYSSDTSVATVDSDGNVTGVSEGSATITATVDGVSGTASITVGPKRIPIESISLSIEKTGLLRGDSFILSAVVLPYGASDTSVKWFSSDDSVAKVAEDEYGCKVIAVSKGTATITALTNDGGKISCCTLSVYDLTAIHEGGQLWADGPYWAPYNLGADKAEDPGLYFSWGDVNGHKPNGDVFNYSFDDDNFSKTPGYGLEEDLPLSPTYDAAIAILGENWRMPSGTELDMLTSEYYVGRCVWIENYHGSGVSGLLVTGDGDYSDNYIFLPGAGNGFGQYLYYKNLSGAYWSKSYSNFSNQFAYALLFDREMADEGTCTTVSGCLIRPVSDKQ